MEGHLHGVLLTRMGTAGGRLARRWLERGAGSPSRSPVNDPCGFIDWPAREACVVPGPLQLRGWCLFPGATVARIEVSLAGEEPQLARLGMERRDIPELFEHTDAPICGFEHMVDIGTLADPPATITIEARAIALDGREHQLEPLTVALLPAAPPLADDDGRAQQLRNRSTMLRQRRSTRRASAPVRILAFAHELPYGGASLYLVELLRRLVRRPEFECSLVSLADGPLRPDLEASGIPVHITDPFPFESIERYEGSQAALAGWAASQGFDVALVNTMSAFSGADLATRLGIPSVWAVHESYELPMFWSTAYLPGTLHPYVRRRAEVALAQANAVVFEAEATRRLYAPYAAEERLITIPYGIELERIDAARDPHRRAELRRALEIEPDARVVLCLGNVEPRKGQAPLAQAFARVAPEHPQALLVFVGATDAPWCAPYVAALRRYAESDTLGGRVRIEPVTQDPYPWHAAADLLVCASDLESLPRSILEAMAFGTPVLSTGIFGAAELVENGRTGFLCPSRDVGALAEALDRALSAPSDSMDAIAAAAAARVRSRHEPAAYAERMSELLAGLAANSRARPADLVFRGGVPPAAELNGGARPAPATTQSPGSLLQRYAPHPLDA